ncbi:MAG: hypothetical protein AB7O52_18670 [Planctomycetota bacterium]
MSYRRFWIVSLSILVLAVQSAGSASAQPISFPPGAAPFAPSLPFNPLDHFNFDLRLADEGDWTQLDPDGDGNDGVYDENLRLVVYKLQNLVFPTPPVGVSRTYTFENHITNCPVAFLVESNFTLPAGVTLSLDGSDSAEFAGAPQFNQPGRPGTGGYRGGYSAQPPFIYGGDALGPGGGRNTSSIADWSGKNFYIPTGGLPLVGGSGGIATSSPWSGARFSGGGGGGAVMIVAGGTASIAGKISVRGGNATTLNIYCGAGGGGTIRIVATNIVGSSTGHLDALGGVTGFNNYSSGLNLGVPGGEQGTIRIELPGAASYQNALILSGLASVVEPTVVDPLSPGSPVKLWPGQQASQDPAVWISTIAGHAVPQGPTGSFLQPDLTITGLMNFEVIILTTGVDTVTSSVTLRATSKQSAASGYNLGSLVLPAQHIGSTLGAEQWRVILPGVPDGYTAYQAYVEL